VKVKLWTHRFFADNHLLDLHDLCDVVGSWLEWRSTRSVIDTDENVSLYIFTSVNTCRPTTHDKRINNNDKQDMLQNNLGMVVPDRQKKSLQPLLLL